MSQKEIPFVHLSPLPKHVEKVVKEVMNEGVFLNGKFTALFEREFRGYLGVKHVITTANCTDALEIILRGHDISKGGEVIVPAFSWFSDASVVKLVGAKPVFADVDPNYFGMLSESIEKLISSKTKAVICPHLFGAVHPYIVEIKALCESHQILLIEDCAQAHGAFLDGKLAGTFGDVAAFSFYPTKNLGALGDAGCIVTNDEDLAEKYRLWANHGQKTRNEHIQLGRNSRMDELQAAVLHSKLPFLNQTNSQRRVFADIYFNELSGLPIALPLKDAGHVYHQFVIRYKGRDQLKEFLLSKGVQTDIHYPHALNDMKVFQTDSAMACPNAEEIAKTVLSLPIHPEHEIADIKFICEQIKLFFKENTSL